MPKPAKPKSTPLNQPPVFDETIAVSGPASRQQEIPLHIPEANDRVGDAQSIRLSEHAQTGPLAPRRTRQWRIIIMIVWAAAALAAGVGLGSLLKNQAAVSFEPPAPIATATIAVAAAPSQISIVSGAPASMDLAGVVSSDAVNQAQAGNIFVTASAGYTQATTGSDALQPGFKHFGRSQGNLGTQPVR